MADQKKKGFGTVCIHADEPHVDTGAVMTPISLATTYHQSSPGQFNGFEYSRTLNPTRKVYENVIASIEGAQFGLAFSSGSAATAAVIGLLKPGDHVVTSDDIYGGTNRFFRRVATPSQGIEVDFVDMLNLDNIKKAIKPSTKLIWLESPSNPTLKVIDIAEATKIGKDNNCIVVVDNTFLSPYFLQPLSLGADITLNSVSKYVNGHSDVIGGYLAMNDKDLRDRLAFIQNGVGAVPSPFDCYQAIRGVKTLAVRMRQHEKNATEVAKFLEKSDKIEKVHYTGLPSHPQHEIAKKQQKGHGGMITFWIKGGLDESRRFLENLKIINLAESLGGVESLIEHPAIMTHASVPAEQRKALGIMDNMVRLSVGIEEIEDLIEDVTFALSKI